MGEVRVELDGTLFQSPEGAVHDFEREATYAAASFANAEVHGNLNASLKNPTPYYETQITMQETAGGHVVHDRGVIYGHWLEGDGSRNSPRTRFRGYWSFRRAERRLSERLESVISGAVLSLVRRLNDG